MKFTLSCECDCPNEIAALVAKMNSKAGSNPVNETPAKKVVKNDDDEENEKPAKKVVKSDDDEEDEKPAKKVIKAADEEKPAKKSKNTNQREAIREKLREFAEKTDRKTAVKFLNKTAESVDDIDEAELQDFLDALQAKIDE